MTVGRQEATQIPFPVRLLTIALIGGGLIGGLTNFLLMPDFWPWSMPALVHRFLAAAAAAYVVGGVLTLTRSGWNESEFLCTTVLIYGVVLVVAVLLDRHLIDWGRPVAWLFVGIVSLALLVVLVYGWRMRYAIRSNRQTQLSPASRLYLVVLGIAAGVVGILVYLVPRQSGWVWPWAVLPAWKVLDSRLVASMLLTVAGGAFLVLWRNHRGALRVLIPMIWAYCLVAAVGIILHALETPAFIVADGLYVVIFAAISIVGLILYLREGIPEAVPSGAIRRSLDVK